MKGRILLVEDEVIIGMALAAELEDADYEVIGMANTGQEALEFVAAEPFDVLILDIKLKGDQDGLQTLKEIRKVANPKVIVVSGNSESATFQEVNKIGVDGFLVKPVSMKELYALLDSLLRP